MDTEGPASRPRYWPDAGAPDLTTSSETPRIGRTELVALLALTMALGALGIDLMLPAFDEIRSAFDLAADSTRVAGIVTTYMLGLAVGTLVYGPLSDRTGRRPALYLGFFLYGVGALGAALAPSLSTILVARFLWGVGAAGPRTMVLSIIRDSYEGDELAKRMSTVFAVFILVPVLAPTLGAGIVAVAPWRWVFWTCVVYVGAIALWATRLPETLDPADRLESRPSDVMRAVGRCSETGKPSGTCWPLPSASEPSSPTSPPQSSS